VRINDDDDDDDDYLINAFLSLPVRRNASGVLHYAFRLSQNNDVFFGPPCTKKYMKCLCPGFFVKFMILF